jgi:hypothetical protein
MAAESSFVNGRFTVVVGAEFSIYPRDELNHSQNFHDLKANIDRCSVYLGWSHCDHDHEAITAINHDRSSLAVRGYRELCRAARDRQFKPDSRVEIPKFRSDRSRS